MAPRRRATTHPVAGAPSVSPHRLEVRTRGVRFGERLGEGVRVGDPTKEPARRSSSAHTTFSTYASIASAPSARTAAGAVQTPLRGARGSGSSAGDSRLLLSARLIRKRQPAQRTMPCRSATSCFGAAWSSAGRGAARHARVVRRPGPGAPGGSRVHPSARCLGRRDGGSSARPSSPSRAGRRRGGRSRSAVRQYGGTPTRQRGARTRAARTARA